MTLSASDPCQACQSTVHIEKRDGPRRQGAATTPQYEVRVCDNPNCRTNDPRQRRVLESP
ncbi:hypothetical protein GCM10027596_26640 [Nocardioides korecus]